MSEVAAPSTDPGALILTKDYRVLLVLAALIGVMVSLAAWGFLELVTYMQKWVYEDLPSGPGRPRTISTASSSSTTPPTAPGTGQTSHSIVG